MLTIRKPIELKTQSPMLGLRQDMAERMQANYGLMNMSIRKEELLHVTSEPPEVYFAEGDNLAIFNTVKNENQQEIRLDVINNLINRIMVSQTENFTYQDTVYISSILRRLGIRDEKTFMKQVFALQNEHKETKQLLQNYENYQEILKKFFVENKQKQTEKDAKEETVSERERRYYIHDAIFQRLETGKIYQDIRLFSKGNRHESQQIFRTEFQIGEQATLEQNFLLQDLKQKITTYDTPLYYSHNNQYEYLQELSENITESLEEQMSAAILLNIVDQSYVLRQQQIEENNHYWYSIAGALFKTAENTWKRYETNLQERKFISGDELQVLDEVNQVKHLESTTIQNIADEYKKLEIQIEKTNHVQNLILQNQTQMDFKEEVSIAGGSYHLSQEELELQFLNLNEEVENENTSITVEQLQEQLNVFNQKNYENYQKMEELAKSRPQIKERKLDRKKAQRDALRALENPTEVLQEYLTAETRDLVTEMHKDVETQIYDMFSEETKEIYRQFLQQTQTTEETFLQHLMNQTEEREVQKENIRSLEQKDIFKQIQKERTDYTEQIQPVSWTNIDEELKQQLQVLNKVQTSQIYEIWTNPKETILQIEQEEKLLERNMTKQQELIKEKSALILQDSNTSISEESVKWLEKLTLVHPEEILETEVLEQKDSYKNLLQQVIQETEVAELQRELIKIVDYAEKKNLLKQIRKVVTEYTEYMQPVVYEAVNENIKQQLQVFEHLQNTNVYEKWTMPADLVWEIEQTAAEIQDTKVLKQQEILAEKKESTLLDSKINVLQETTKQIEKQTMLHPEMIIESEEIYSEQRQKNILQVQELNFTDLQQNVEKQLKLQQTERAILLNQREKEEVFRKIDFVHKVEEQFFNEELLEELRTQKQNIRREEHTEQTTLENKKVVQQTVQESVNHIQTNQLNQIEELVQKSVKRQIGDLSDQVYGKIEKKLQTERKRRGYF